MMKNGHPRIHGEAIRDLWGVVRRSVIYNDDFAIREIPQGSKTILNDLFQTSLFVEGGNDDG